MIPETMVTPYDLSAEERARLTPDGWEEWCELVHKGYPPSMLWVRWPKPPKPSLAEAMERLRQEERGWCGRVAESRLAKCVRDALAAYDAQTEDPTRDALIAAALAWRYRNEGLDALLDACRAYRKAHPDVD